MKRRYGAVSGLVLLLAAAALLGACAANRSLARHHPEEVRGIPRCSECHDNAYTAMDHTSDYGERHRFYASQRRQICALCHKPSFCADCHANREELKPSDKYKDEPWRSLPHRGDYLIQHRIDGQIDPAPCFKCHGRRNDWRCRSCHR